MTKEKVLVNRRELFTDFELPMCRDYNKFVTEIIERSEKPNR